MTEPHVRRAESADLESFAAVLGDRAFFDDRFRRQQEKHGVLFLGWLGPLPAGAVYLWLAEAEEKPISDHLPGVPLITHLEVHQDLRRNGVGTALVREAERRLLEKGRYRVALAVRTDNDDAARLYKHLGYRDWGHGEVICLARKTLPDGTVLTEEEVCYVLVSDLVPITPAPRTEADPAAAPHPC
ncbi:GNAT family N-acetyltransferase [Amycolatopsis sp. NPDC058278]|jgi:ribosomal protein S18 acetylase RimI-like enzyme|uniref:GNAT family N-acetyltransferase n=1 Tax=unclassified Amycolatopsis TaxID=2618356 RepID=UPI00255BE96B|nr:GNAT family N-acetyltransferase [Amycolatopsis sp. DG1A-15b]WIX84422.1 GNAT family N-acetyltransferase [Amycolatopsis sp. DG1A-15b]